MSAAPRDCFELVPQKLVYGGAALGHHTGRPVLVPYALPGERVLAETAREAKGMVYARLRQVIEPSPERVAAACPYFGRCGGCHYQHLDSSRQLAIKRDILRETLRRVGHIDWQGEIHVHASEPWRYRNQVQLKTGGGSAAAIGAIGFFAADSHDLVPIDCCPISSPRLNAVIQELARPERAARLADWSEVELRTDDGDERVVLWFRGAGPTLDRDAASYCSPGADSSPSSVEQAMERLAEECLSLLPGVSGVAFETAATRRSRTGSHAPRWRSSEMRVFGDATLTYRVGEFAYRVSPGSFFQSSRYLLPEFVAAVTSDLGESPVVAPGLAFDAAPGLALDLYAGVGLFTLPLARAFGQVVAVESNPQAAADLAWNVRANGAGNARAACSSAAEFLRRYAQAAPALVVLDPPRAGAEGETLRHLIRIGFRQVRYVSCHPPTLARDLEVLLRHGYAIERVDLFDLFPQTFHIESVVRLRKV
jgi:23S rRNA (uracil1939-C5)-methyltransferase